MTASDKLDDLVVEPVTTKGPVELDGGDQDDLDDQAISLFAKVRQATVRTSRAAIDWGRTQVTDKTKGWSGYCWRFARLCFGVDALAPSAIAGWDMAGPNGRVRCTAAEAPRGYVGIFSGGKYGHAVLLLGSDRCLSNDTQGDDQIHVAAVTGIEKAWGYKFLGYLLEVNGVTAPPAKAAPKPSWKLDRKWKLAQLRNARNAARANGHLVRAKRLQRWIDQLVRTGAAK